MYFCDASGSNKHQKTEMTNNGGGNIYKLLPQRKITYFRLTKPILRKC